MANADNPRGLRPVQTVSGQCYTGATRMYYVPDTDATAIYMGGLVKLAGDADAQGVPAVTGNVASGDTVLGVVVSVGMPIRDSKTFHEASTEGYVMVADDPDLLFEIQDDGAVASTSAEVGNVANLAGILLGNATTGRSEMEVDSATWTDAGAGTEDVVLMGLVQDERNEFGVNANWLVRLNNHAFANGFVGA